MSTARHHADWLSLVEVSGPFVSLPVLLRTFPQGLEPRDPAQAKQLRTAYEDWQDNPTAPGKQRAWALHVIQELLGYPANQISKGQTLPAGLEVNMAEQGETLRPDFALIGPAGSEAAGQSQLLISIYPAEQPLDKPVIGKHWKATPATRMMELLHGTNVPLGLVTNGEQWMLVYAPRGETTGYASWYGALWLDEPITLRAFQSLLGVRRFFGVAADSTLLALLKESASDQQEVTDQLGYQVREAVEVLVQSFDAIQQESQGIALKGIPPTTVYDAALTIMMRLVFLFSAEERGLLHLGKPLYDNNYAVSTLQEQLQEVADQNGEEVLERRYDAWARLLATFRAVHGGIQHQDLLMQAYGGSLLDPDRYPFLEGRAAGSTWRSQSAAPLPVNNRVVLHLLNSLQRLRIKNGGATETRRVSFRALGVEQIGHVYEGLLDHTAQRAAEVVLGIRGTRSKEPEIPLSTLEQLLAKGEDALLEHLKEETGRSLPALRKELNGTSAFDEHKLLVACRQDEALQARLRPFAGLIREDSFERPWVVLPGSVFVTAGTTRRSTGTHYTPPSLTEPIVRHTLEPLVYMGPAEGLPKEEWKLKSPKEILALKVCDMAMGSGAFLVQACRYLAERLVEAWENEEKAHPGQVLITPDGKFSDGSATERLVPVEAAERIAIARRVVADRCLYGVDINPMAVEMAKLSMWLITVDKNRPFTFLDHAFKCGDSLLGITSLEQLENFSLRLGSGKQQAFATLDLKRYVEQAKTKRETVEAMPSDTPEQISVKCSLYAEAVEQVAKLRLAADALMAIESKGLPDRLYEVERETLAATIAAQWDMEQASHKSSNCRKEGGGCCFHWALEFPEIMREGGFSAFVGNPPFIGGRQLPTALGFAYSDALRTVSAVSGPADYCCYFFRRSFDLLSKLGHGGLLATNSISETVNAEAALNYISTHRGTITRAIKTLNWPGEAAVTVSLIHFTKHPWQGYRILNSLPVAAIPATLDSAADVSKIYSIKQGFDYSQGANAYGAAFIKTQTEVNLLRNKNPDLNNYLRRYINGDILNDGTSLDDSDWIIDFGERDLDQIHGCDQILDDIKKSVAYERRNQTRQVHESRPWLHWDKRTKFFKSARQQEHMLATVLHSSFFTIHVVPTKHFFAHGLELFLTDDLSILATLQSSFHEYWARLTSGSIGVTTRYTASKCLATFPFPLIASKDASAVAKEILELRNELMAAGMSTNAAYARFHSPTDKTEKIDRLRRLHIDLDQAVCQSYGWSSLNFEHDYYETRQGIRFTISEAARRQVLDRLLSLNHQRHAEEVAAGLHDQKSAKPPKSRKATVAADAALQNDLFGPILTDSTPVCESATGPSPIVEYLRTNRGWHSKDDILASTGFPENRWNVAIRDLLDSGRVTRQGEKRGAKYQAAPKDDT